MSGLTSLYPLWPWTTFKLPGLPCLDHPHLPQVSVLNLAVECHLWLPMAASIGSKPLQLPCVVTCSGCAIHRFMTLLNLVPLQRRQRRLKHPPQQHLPQRQPQLPQSPPRRIPPPQQIQPSPQWRPSLLEVSCSLGGSLVLLAAKITGPVACRRPSPEHHGCPH